MTWSCRHYGARPLSVCYCGAYVPRSAWLMAQAERRSIQQELGQGWRPERDATGQVVRMWWRG
jgi:hypothetical protein